MCLPRYVRWTIVTGRNLESVRMPEEFRITAFDLLLAGTLLHEVPGGGPTACSSCRSAHPTVFIENAAA